MELSGKTFRELALDLGRDVELINKLEDYSLILAQKHLPVIFSPQHLALLMGKDYECFDIIIRNRETYYEEFEMKKKSGGVRHIMAPSGELKLIQQWIKIFILDKLSFPDYVTAYQPNKSIFHNAKPHVGKELVMKFDLKKYFDTITENKVYGIFLFLGYTKSVSYYLAKFCCVIPSVKHKFNLLSDICLENFYKNQVFSVIPQGASTSPGISNLAAFMMDFRLNKYAAKNGFSYTRYADDLTFSGEVRNKLKKTMIKKVVVEEGFILNEKKGSYRQKGNKQIVTGLNVNTKVSIPKKKRKQIFSHLYNCIQFGPYNHLDKINMRHKMNYRDWLLGHILYIYSIQPEVGKKMKAKFDMINWI